MKLKTTVLLSALILSATANAAVITDNKDGTIMIQNEIPSRVKVLYFLDKNSPLAKEPVNYNLKVYIVEAKKSLVTTSGVYNNNSPLLDVKGQLLTTANVVGQPVGNISSTKEKSYLRSETTEIKDSLNSLITSKMDVVRTGFDLAAFQIKKNTYSIGIFQSSLEGVKDFETDDSYVQLPQVNEWKTISEIYIPSGKTARIDSSVYKIDGKEYKNVYILSTNNG